MPELLKLSWGILLTLLTNPLKIEHSVDTIIGKFDLEQGSMLITCLSWLLGWCALFQVTYVNCMVSPKLVMLFVGLIKMQFRYVSMCCSLYLVTSSTGALLFTFKSNKTSLLLLEDLIIAINIFNFASLIYNLLYAISVTSGMCASISPWIDDIVEFTSECPFFFLIYFALIFFLNIYFIIVLNSYRKTLLPVEVVEEEEAAIEEEEEEQEAKEERREEDGRNRYNIRK